MLLLPCPYPWLRGAFGRRDPYAPKSPKQNQVSRARHKRGLAPSRGSLLVVTDWFYSFSLTVVQGIMKSSYMIVLVPLPAFPRHIGKADEGMGRIGMHLIHGTPVEPDISRHMYICGETGVGKTTLLHNLMVQDIHDGKGFAFFDPHGDEAENLLNFIPQHRVEDVIYFAPHDRERPVTLNPLRGGCQRNTNAPHRPLQTLFEPSGRIPTARAPCSTSCSRSS
jgi:uncharacterized protein DUF87